MRHLPYLLILIAFSHVAHASDPHPKAEKSRWRIPPNAAVTAVGIDLKWHVTPQRNGGVSLQAGLAEHHTYEQAWAYYTNMFGLQTDYTASSKQQKRVVDGDKRVLIEHDRDQIFKAGRWTRMYGKFGRYKTSLSLFDDPTLPKSSRVYVNIVFDPE